MPCGILRRLGFVGTLLVGVCWGTNGCGGLDGGGTDTGLLIRVTVAEGHEEIDGHLNRLEFYVAFSTNGIQGPFVFDHVATGQQAFIGFQSLLENPYRLLIKEDGDNVMETLKVWVLAYKNDEFKAWGHVQDPSHQTFIPARIVMRTVALVSADRQGLPFRILRTGCFLFGDYHIAHPHDMDCDGVPETRDCDDENSNVRPGVQEICDNNVDDNCNGVTDEEVDEDLDGYSNCDNDCNDRDRSIHPEADELCDGKDNNCNGLCDEIFDPDNDGYTNCGNGTGTYIQENGLCEGPPLQEKKDCAPDNPFVNPGEYEECDGIDNNCDGRCDEGYDNDQDGWTTCGSTRGNNPDLPGCTALELWAEDCDDQTKEVNPGAEEICDGRDTNCDPYDDLTGATQPCLVLDQVTPTDELCKRGFRTCEDANGIGWSDCDISVDPMVVAASQCSLYDVCADLDPDDPFYCVESAGYAQTAYCHVYSPTEFQVCGQPPWYPLPWEGLSTQCYWRILDPAAAPDWQLELMYWDANQQNYMPAGTEVNECDVAISATYSASVNQWPPQMQWVEIVYVGDGGAEVIVYNVGFSMLQASGGCTVDMEYMGW